MPEDKEYKLWKALNSSGQYTKSYEEFKNQFSAPEKQDTLYSVLQKSGKYTKTNEEFKNQFFVYNDKNSKYIVSVLIH